jgi:LacI family transcriptional regulator
VLVDRKLKQLEAVSITVDNRPGSREGVLHLARHGYRRIAIMKGLPSVASLEDRFLDYKEALKLEGIPFDPQLVKYGELNTEISKKQALELLEMKNRPDSLFIRCESMIVGTVLAITESGLRIPEDIWDRQFGPSAVGRDSPTLPDGDPTAQLFGRDYCCKNPN